MFGDRKIRIDRELWQKIERYAAIAGYASPQEFVTHALEKEVAYLEESDSEEEVRKKLKGLGYIS
jgi:hypothetical protein